MTAQPQTLPARLRRSVTTGAVPPATEFDLNDLAINLADGLLFWRDTGGTVRTHDLLARLLAPLASPAFTGTPTAPTPPAGDRSGKLATTGFVGAELTALVASAPAALDTLKELADAIGDDANFAATMAAALGNRLRLDAAGGYTDAQAAQGRSNIAAADVSAMGAANLLVNGFHTVSQELGTTARSGYVTDQWIVAYSGSLVATGQQVASPFATQPDIPFGLKLAITTASATLATGDNLFVAQPIEGINLARLLYGTSAAKPVTIAFMARSSIATVGYCSLRSVNSSGTVIRSYLTRFALAANTDTFVTIQVPGDVAQALLTTNALSLYASWCFGAGATYQTAAGAWTAGSYLAGADITNLAASTANSVVLSGAVMFPGLVPVSQAMLPLLARPVDEELRKCQRYYWSSGALTDFFAQFGANQYQTISVGFPVLMRNNPSVTMGTSSSGASPLTPYVQYANAYRCCIRADVNNTTGYSVLTQVVANARM